MLVVSKLHVGDVVDPFLGSVSAVDPKVCFDDLVHSFGSSISLWVIGCAHGRFGVAESGQFLEDLGGKLRTIIRNDAGMVHLSQLTRLCHKTNRVTAY